MSTYDVVTEDRALAASVVMQTLSLYLYVMLYIIIIINTSLLNVNH